MTAQQHRRRLIFWGALSLIIMGAIFFFSSQPASDSSSLSEFLLNTRLGQLLMRLLPSLSEQGDSHDIRKYAHMTEFFCLGVSVLMFVRELMPAAKRKFPVFPCVPWLWCLFYACTDEFHQLFVEGRSCQLSDVGVDGIGFTAGILVAGAIISIRSKIKRAPEKEERHNG